MTVDKANTLGEQAFSPNNPAVVLWQLLSNDKESLEALAARLGSKPELDAESFLCAAQKLEQPKEAT